jgi:hypothetical protein
MAAKDSRMIVSPWARWRSFPLVYAAYTALFALGWQRHARERPATVKFTGLAQNLGQLYDANSDFQSKFWANLIILGQSCGFQVAAAPAPSERADAVAVDWSIFRVPAVVAMITAQFGSGCAVYTMMQWQPIYFTEVLGCTPMRAAVLFAWQEAASFIADWSVGILETVAERRGVKRLTIRKVRGGDKSDCHFRKRRLNVIGNLV